MLKVSTSHGIYVLYVFHGRLRTVFQGKEVMISTVRNLAVGECLSINGWYADENDGEGEVVMFTTSEIESIENT